MIFFDWIVSTIQLIFSEACSYLGYNYWVNVEYYSPYISLLTVVAFVFVVYFIIKLTVAITRWFFRI